MPGATARPVRAGLRNWNSKSRQPSPCLSLLEAHQSPPCLTLIAAFLISLQCSSRRPSPSRRAWIETTRLGRRRYRMGAPHAGAWIETPILAVNSRRTDVARTRARGLKLSVPLVLGNVECRTTRGAWIETATDTRHDGHDQVALRQGRGLKIPPQPIRSRTLRRPSRRGVD